MTNYLIIIICLLALTQNGTRLFPAAVFSCINLAHFVAMDGSDGNIYCLSAALFDLLTVWLIVNYSKISMLSDSLIIVSVISFFTNIYGWILWVNYLPVAPYNQIMSILYCIAILSLLGIHTKNGIKNNSHDSGVFLPDYSVRHFCRCIHQEKGA